MAELKQLPLGDFHRELGAKMVPFAGYEMPVQYALGVKGEHLHTRDSAGLFDVSHMGQAYIEVDGLGTTDAHERVAAAIERVVPGEIRKLGKGRIRYTVLLNEDGGILDDLMITRLPSDEDAGRLFVVVNAAVKEQDFAYLREHLGVDAKLRVLHDRALIAIQGPMARAVMTAFIPEADEMPFMSMMDAEFEGLPIMLSRCGYTGEDGYELSVPAEEAEFVARRLVERPVVEPIGLGARDSLRLEAGLCLYGHDMTPAESPVEASLEFAIGKRRREEGDFAGAHRVLKELEDGPSKVRVGIKPLGRAPAREGVEIQSENGETIGTVTSGGFGPTYDGPIAMGYVTPDHAMPGTKVNLIIRGKAMEAEIVTLPFVEQRYYRAPKKA